LPDADKTFNGNNKISVVIMWTEVNRVAGTPTFTSARLHACERRIRVSVTITYKTAISKYIFWTPTARVPNPGFEGGMELADVCRSIGSLTVRQFVLRKSCTISGNRCCCGCQRLYSLIKEVKSRRTDVCDENVEGMRENRKKRHWKWCWKINEARVGENLSFNVRPG
jgi:hypothetical protein